MAQSFFPVDVVDISLADAASWQDNDISAYIPAGATGAIVQYHNSYAGATPNISFRKKGSTDNRTPRISGSHQGWAIIGVDSNRVFEVYAYTGMPTTIKLYLHGYTTSGVTFNTNAPSISLSSTGIYESVDLSALCPGAVGVILEIKAGTGLESFDVRMNGSTDELYRDVAGHNCFTLVAGCDSNQIIEIKRESTNLEFYILGYITDGANFNTNVIDASITATGSWEDLSALFGNMALLRIDGPGGQFALRKNGTTPTEVYAYNQICIALVESDTNLLVEGKRQTTDTKFYIVGNLGDFALPLSDTLTITDATGKECGKNVSDTLSISDSASNAVGKGLSDTINISDSPSKAVGKSLDDTINVSDSAPSGLEYFRRIYLDAQLLTGLDLDIQLLGGHLE